MPMTTFIRTGLRISGRQDRKENGFGINSGSGELLPDTSIPTTSFELLRVTCLGEQSSGREIRGLSDDNARRFTLTVAQRS